LLGVLGASAVTLLLPLPLRLPAGAAPAPNFLLRFLGVLVPWWLMFFPLH